MIFSLCFLGLLIIQNVYAWLPPERCQQTKIYINNHFINPQNYFSNLKEDAPVIPNITEIAERQKNNLIIEYNQTKFFGVPIRGHYDGYDRQPYTAFKPSQCKFYTYSPNIISSVFCQKGTSCKLTETVSTVDSYTSSEGYNWGVKISSKGTIIKDVFEVGGEVSTGGTYSCSYTKSQTKTNSVECSVSNGEDKTLRLYNVKSDMICDFSEVTMIPEIRNGKDKCWAPFDYFTVEEMEIVHKNALIKSVNNLILPDMDKMSDNILRKWKKVCPDYNPYTDIIEMWRRPSQPSVAYYKLGSTGEGYTNIIPFTNENGNRVYQYACILS